MKVLVVRAIEDARRTAARLSSRGHEAIVAPALEMRRLNHAIPNIAYDALIATSAHAFDTALPERIAGLPAFVVGERTAEALRRVDALSTPAVAQNAMKLIDLFCERFQARVSVLYLAGRDRKPDLECALGVSYDLHVVETYAAEAVHTLCDEVSAALKSRNVDAVFHYSRRSAEIFCEIVQAASLSADATRIRHIAISADAGAPLIAAGWSVEIATAPDEDAMLSMLDRRQT